MNELITATGPLTMTSVEIAELCEKEHKNVLADIRKMLEELEKDWPIFRPISPTATGGCNPGAGRSIRLRRSKASPGDTLILME